MSDQGTKPKTPAGSQRYNEREQSQKRRRDAGGTRTTAVLNAGHEFVDSGQLFSVLSKKAMPFGLSIAAIDGIADGECPAVG
jgi:hypothetical protein